MLDQRLRLTTTKSKILAVSIILMLAFIWIHSMMPRSVSGQESGWVTLHVIQPVLSLLGIEGISETVVRKLAHITEFFVLSVLVTSLFNGKWLISFHFCFSVAFLDESIQLLSGRGSQIQDVWIDKIGIVIAILGCSIARRLIGSRQEKRQRGI